MRFGYGIPAVLACALMLAPGMALAQKPVLNPIPLDVGTIDEVRIGAPLSSHTACTLGNLNAPAIIIDYFLPPNDQYYTLLRADQCPACTGQGGVLLNLAHMLVNHPSACGLQVTVSVVEADMTNPACPVPDPSRPVCDPITYQLVPPTPGNIDWSMGLPNGCCITTDSFLLITVDAFVGDCSGGVPRLITSGACNACESWNFWGAGNQDEACSIGFPGNFSHYVEGDCCETTSGAKESWGRVKTMYR